MNKQKLIEEFGQGIIDHVSRNRGKYALGAGAAGLIGYGAYNGNLSNAINVGTNGLSGLAGIATSDLPSDAIEYSDAPETLGHMVSTAYAAPEEDPEMAFAPVASFKTGHVVGDGLAVVDDTMNNVKGMFESEEIVDDSEEDESSTTTNAALAAGAGALGTAALMNKKAIKAKLEKPLNQTKKATGSVAGGLGNALLKVSKNLKK